MIGNFYLKTRINIYNHLKNIFFDPIVNEQFTYRFIYKNHLRSIIFRNHEKYIVNHNNIHTIYVPTYIIFTIYNDFKF